MQITDIFFSCKKIKVHSPAAEAVLTSTHNLCFGAKIRKIGIHICISQFCYIKVGFKGAVYITRTCYVFMVKIRAHAHAKYIIYMLGEMTIKRHQAQCLYDS